MLSGGRKPDSETVAPLMLIPGVWGLRSAMAESPNPPADEVAENSAGGQWEMAGAGGFRR